MYRYILHNINMNVIILFFVLSFIFVVFANILALKFNDPFIPFQR